MKRGFKTHATKLALEIRAELRLDAFGPFDPYELAHEYGIEVDPLTSLGLGDDILRHATGNGSTFSGALLHIDGMYRIVENDLHAPTRRRATVSHEMSHVLLEHDHPATVRYDRQCGIGAEQEDEATWLAGELLVPHEAALRAAWSDATDETVAHRFQVSVAEARWRMNHSGVRMIVERSRAKHRRRDSR